MNPKVSVIIPCYNCEATIEKTVDSILNQSYKNFEIYLIDDCSTHKESYEKLFDIQRKHPNYSIVVLKTEKNSGQSITRNLGIKRSTGSYIAFIDSDDRWSEKKLEKQVSFMDEHREIMFTGTDMVFKSNLHKKNMYFSDGERFELITLKKLLWKNVFGMSTIVIRNCGYFFDENIRYSSDFAYLCNVLKNNKGVLMHFFGTIYDDEGTNRISSTKKREQHLSNINTLRLLRREKEIVYFEYIFFRLIYFLKYVRNKIFR